MVKYMKMICEELSFPVDLHALSILFTKNQLCQGYFYVDFNHKL